jgi:hypothetical protein
MSTHTSKRQMKTLDSPVRCTKAPQCLAEVVSEKAKKGPEICFLPAGYKPTTVMQSLRWHGGMDFHPRQQQWGTSPLPLWVVPEQACWELGVWPLLINNKATPTVMSTETIWGTWNSHSCSAKQRLNYPKSSVNEGWVENLNLFLHLAITTEKQTI